MGLGPNLVSTADRIGVIAIAVQAFLLAQVGLVVGARAGEKVPGATERLAGVALLVLGCVRDRAVDAMRAGAGDQWGNPGRCACGPAHPAPLSCSWCGVVDYDDNDRGERGEEKEGDERSSPGLA